MRIPDGAAFIQALRRGRLLWQSNPTLFYRRLANYLRRPTWGMHELFETPRRSARIQESYHAWLQCRSQTSQIPNFAPDEAPLLSVIMPVFNTPTDLLRAAMESVLSQTYHNWELCVVDDASTERHVLPLLHEFAAKDSRVVASRRPAQGHISAASNTALAQSHGEFIVLLDHDDVLAPHALAAVADVIRRESAVDFIYSDEDKLDTGARVEPFFKPAWSPTLLNTGNYITHLCAMRRTLVVDAGGFRDEMVGSQDHDLFLRVAERARTVVHIPDVLYSWRKSPTSTAVATTAKPYAIGATRRALQDTIARRGLDGTLEPGHLNGLFTLQPRLHTPTTISLIVRGSLHGWTAELASNDLKVCDSTAIDRTATAESVADAITRGRGNVLVFLDAEEPPATAQSVRYLIATAQGATGGMAGGMTIDRTAGHILQAGVAIGDQGQPFRAYSGSSLFPQRNFYLNLKDLPREVSAVHPGCSAVQRSTWEGVGGWSPDLPLELAFYDLCLRTLSAGYINVYAPAARFETSGQLPPIPSVAVYSWAWTDFHDPFWNPNLSPSTPDGLPFRCDISRAPRLRAASARPSAPPPGEDDARR